MVIFEQRVPGTHPEIQLLSPEIDLGTRPGKVLKEALSNHKGTHSQSGAQVSLCRVLVCLRNLISCKWKTLSPDLSEAYWRFII